ncbi:MAG TPA: tripartite tricarboxylate transporter substrate binding protein [Burkholderiales bacterium]
MMKLVCRLILAAAALTAAAQAQAQTYPKQPIRLILPFAAGGLVDVIGRFTAQKMSETLGQPFVVENVAGAGGTIAAAQVAHAPADGYTLLNANASTLTITPALYRSLSYDAEKAFVPVGAIGQFYFVMGANNAVTANNLREFVAYAKANPGKLNYGSPGFGTTPHLAGEMLKRAAGLQMTHVPYKGAGQVVQALVAGDVQVFFDARTLLGPLVQAGKIKALAVTSPARMKELPQVPTAAESGVKEIEFSTWTAWVAPAATPPEVLAVLRGALAKVTASTEMREMLANRGFEPFNVTPEGLAERVRTETPRWAEIIRASGVKLE